MENGGSGAFRAPFDHATSPSKEQNDQRATNGLLASSSSSSSSSSAQPPLGYNGPFLQTSHPTAASAGPSFSGNPQPNGNGAVPSIYSRSPKAVAVSGGSFSHPSYPPSTSTTQPPASSASSSQRQNLVHSFSGPQSAHPTVQPLSNLSIPFPPNNFANSSLPTSLSPLGLFAVSPAGAALAPVQLPPHQAAQSFSQLQPLTPTQAPSPDCPVYVMLPLDTVSEGGFRYAASRWFHQSLKMLKYAGCHGVAVDVWWGVVEPEPRKYDFSGYRRLADVVDSYGLKLQCVLSFHACGACVGDEVSVPLPAWVREAGLNDPDLFFLDGSEHIPAPLQPRAPALETSLSNPPAPPSFTSTPSASHHPSFSATQGAYGAFNGSTGGLGLGSEASGGPEGGRSRARSSGYLGGGAPPEKEAPLQAEYISIWADEDNAALGGRSPLQAYHELSRAFAEEFRPLLGSVIDEVVVGLGPSGELRYPSHQGQKGWTFPGVGRFQCFDRRASASLQEAARRRGRPEWGVPIPVKDCGSYNAGPEDTPFFRDQDGGWETEQGRFFLEWYSQSLIDHGDRVLKAVLSGLRGDAPAPPTSGQSEHPLYALLRSSYNMFAGRSRGGVPGAGPGGRLHKAPSLETLFPVLPTASSLTSLEEYEGEGEEGPHLGKGPAARAGGRRAEGGMILSMVGQARGSKGATEPDALNNPPSAPRPAPLELTQDPSSLGPSPSNSWADIQAASGSGRSAGPGARPGRRVSVPANAAGLLARDLQRATHSLQTASSAEGLDELDRTRSGQLSPGPSSFLPGGPQLTHVASGVLHPGSPTASMVVDPDTMEQIKLHMRNTFRSSLSRRGSTASLDKLRASAGAPNIDAAQASRPPSITLPQNLQAPAPVPQGLGQILNPAAGPEHLRRVAGQQQGLRAVHRRSWGGSLNMVGGNMSSPNATPGSANPNAASDGVATPTSVGIVRVSVKIAGIHWLFATRSHAAELTSGYYNVEGRDGYRPLAELCARHGVGLTFTCMEMHRDQHPASARSDCEALVDQVRRACAAYQVPLSGENALALFSASGVDVLALKRIECRAGCQPLSAPLELALPPHAYARTTSLGAAAQKGGPRRSLNLDPAAGSLRSTPTHSNSGETEMPTPQLLPSLGGAEGTIPGTEDLALPPAAALDNGGSGSDLVSPAEGLVLLSARPVLSRAQDPLQGAAPGPSEPSSFPGDAARPRPPMRVSGDSNLASLADQQLTLAQHRAGSRRVSGDPEDDRPGSSMGSGQATPQLVQSDFGSQPNSAAGPSQIHARSLTAPSSSIQLAVPAGYGAGGSQPGTSGPSRDGTSPPQGPRSITELPSLASFTFLRLTQDMLVTGNVSAFVNFVQGVYRTTRRGGPGF